MIDDLIDLLIKRFGFAIVLSVISDRLNKAGLTAISERLDGVVHDLDEAAKAGMIEE